MVDSWIYSLSIRRNHTNLVRREEINLKRKSLLVQFLANQVKEKTKKKCNFSFFLKYGNTKHKEKTIVKPKILYYIIDSENNTKTKRLKRNPYTRKKIQNETQNHKRMKQTYFSFL
jgi:hypothetical protein